MVGTKTAGRDRKTLESLIKLYCSARHEDAGGGLCPDCAELLKYSLVKYEVCAFKEDGKLCSRCEVHCYREPYREKIKAVMRYSGPRLIFYHPLLAIRYLFKLAGRGAEK